MTKTKFGLSLIAIGLLLIAAALLLAGYNLYSDLLADKASRQALMRLGELANSSKPSPEVADIKVENDSAESDSIESQIVSSSPTETEIPDYILNPDMKMPTENIDGIDYIGVLQISALELELPIIDSWDYEKLKSAPCRYTGSAYKNDLVICGHDYRSHFGKLKSISIGDIATFTDIDGNSFSYKAASIELLPKTAIAEIVTSEWDLTLFTCTTDGQSRMAIRFEICE